MAPGGRLVVRDRPQRQAGLGPLQDLALRLLIAAQDQGFLRRVEIKADHVRCTLACEMPASRAIARQLHRARVAGGVTAFSIALTRNRGALQFRATWSRQDY